MDVVGEPRESRRDATRIPRWVLLLLLVALGWGVAIMLRSGLAD
jgi:hypothetical protein